jgi:hypothetical protein
VPSENISFEEKKLDLLSSILGIFSPSFYPENNFKVN